MLCEIGRFSVPCAVAKSLGTAPLPSMRCERLCYTDPFSLIKINYHIYQEIGSDVFFCSLFRTLLSFHTSLSRKTDIETYVTDVIKERICGEIESI